MPKPGAAGKRLEQVWLLAQPSSAIYTLSPGGRNQILSVLAAEEEVRVEREMGKARCTQRRRARAAGSRGPWQRGSESRRGRASKGGKPSKGQKSERQGRQGRERRRDARNRTKPVLGRVRSQSWIRCPTGKAEVLGRVCPQESGDTAWDHRGTANRTGLEGWGQGGESRDGKVGGVPSPRIEAAGSAFWG